MTEIYPFFEYGWASILPRGDLWDALGEFLPTAAIMLSGFSLIAIFVWKNISLLPSNIHHWCAGRFSGIKEFTTLGLGLVSMILILDGSSFWHGFFRQDDFSFLAVAQGGYSLSQQMIMYHNDHFYPLFRLQVSALLALAGPSANEVTLSAWFNLVSLLSHAAVLWTAAWLLHEAGAKRGTITGFSFLVWIWPGWGEFVAGYYTLGVYIQVLALGLAGVAAALRFLRTNRRRWQLIALLLALSATGLNISGIWTFVAQGIAVFCLRWPIWRHRQGRGHLAATMALFLASAFSLMVLLSHERSPREFVQNPTGSNIGSVFSRLDNQPISVAGLTIVSAPGGILLSLPIPTYLQLGANKVAQRPALQSTITCLQLAPLVGLLRWWYRRRKHLEKSDSSFMATVLGIVLALAAMVVLARIDYAVASPVLFWPPKYQISIWVWTVLGLAFLVEKILATYPNQKLAITRSVAITLIGGIAVHSFHSSFERNVSPEPDRYRAQGRSAHLNAAKIRREEYQAVLLKLESIRHTQGSSIVRLPPPPNWREAFALKYPMLEWSQDTSFQGVTYLFADLPFARPATDLRIAWTPPPDPELATDPQEYWFAP